MTQLSAVRPPKPLPKGVRRYTVGQLSGVLHWGIYDWTLGDWCSLAYGTSLLPLEWKTQVEAETWLYVCRIAWAHDLVPAPEGWNVR